LLPSWGCENKNDDYITKKFLMGYYHGLIRAYVWVMTNKNRQKWYGLLGMGELWVIKAKSPQTNLGNENRMGY